MKRQKTQNKYFIFDRPKVFSFKHFVKTILLKPFELLYATRLVLFRPKNITHKKYSVCLCSIFKNEAAYIKEWLEYHKIVGIEHFFLYNNNSTDDYQAVLAPYLKEGIVTLVQWEKNHSQMQAYQDAIKNYSCLSDWLCFLDLDEYIVPNAAETVGEFLSPFLKKAPVVIAYWKMFGSSGLSSRNKKSFVTQDFTVSWRKYTDIGKVFFNTHYDFPMNDKHNSCLHHYMWGAYKNVLLPPVNVFGKMCVFGKNPVPLTADASCFPLQINHYFSKSLAEYKEKCAKGDVYYKTNPHDLDYFFFHESFNQATDYSIYRYLMNLKIAMEQKE